MRPFALVDRELGVELELAVRSEQLHREHRDSQRQFRAAQLHDRTFWPRRQSL
jgi:hypothetical protein